eukprot:CAMPEP_0197881164 /NCGR_PEP_ID=MMETSP1439-20131203/8742_1 /TAXON_ID=66791 /ORGANISM="Gonyaulax spinifera, Strain CCMP409" /LENGTH=246 /DNA_ID=CAMNT_0043500753 /DNA_START=1 /DNA_END=738 /DNA_ORIENTATION=+
MGFGPRLTASAMATPAENANQPEAAAAPVGYTRNSRDRDALKYELSETITDRKAFERKLRDLQAEVRLCEASLEALVQRERWLVREIAATPAAPPAKVEDFLEGRGTGPTGPVFFELEGGGGPAGGPASESPCTVTATQGAAVHELSMCSEEENVTEIEDVTTDGSVGTSICGEDYEESLELGVAKCRHCGLRFPLDMETIEQHSKSCSRDMDTSSQAAGRCSECGERIPLTVRGVEAHACACRAA